MIAYQPSRICIFFVSFLFTSILLATCGGKAPEELEVRETPFINSVDELGEVEVGEPEFDGAIFEEAELPEAFPPSFPIPDEARIGSNIGMGGEDEFRIFISLTSTLDEALAYYRSELPARGWTILAEEASNRGTEVSISSVDYEGELLFVAAEMGAAMDVYLYPPGTAKAIPDLTIELGESGALSEGLSSFPANFPIPSSYTPIEINDTLRAEGYELAFTYEGIAEMGMLDLNITLMSSGWEIGDMTLEGMSGMYVLPFSHPESGFEGYAFITSNPGQFNMDTNGAVLVALSQGRP